MTVITESIVEYLLTLSKLMRDAEILDVGAGSGFFIIYVANKVRRPISMTSFYVMDITPAMLSILEGKNSKIMPSIGIT
ncbi:MAG: class I SAM-dependent methyltransferase [Nitrososphaeria archaeon]